MQDKCAIKRCRNNSDIIYLGVPLCNKCWDKLCEKSSKDMKRILGIKHE